MHTINDVTVRRHDKTVYSTPLHSQHKTKSKLRDEAFTELKINVRTCFVMFDCRKLLCTKF